MLAKLEPEFSFPFESFISVFTHKVTEILSCLKIYLLFSHRKKPRGRHSKRSRSRHTMDLRSILNPGSSSVSTPPFLAHGFCLPGHRMAVDLPISYLCFRLEEGEGPKSFTCGFIYSDIHLHHVGQMCIT